MTPMIQSYRVPELTRNPKNPRGNNYDAVYGRTLAKSLRQRQWMPIIVKEPEKVILEGNYRHFAAELDGIETLYGISVTNELSPQEINRMIAQLDLCHLPFSKRARGNLWLTIREENGWTNAQLAKELDVSPGLLTQVFGNLENPDEIQQMVEDNVLTLRDGYHLSRIDDLSERLRMARELAAGRVTHEGLARVVRKACPPADGQKSERRVNRIACPLPSGVIVTISGAEITLDDAADAVAELLKELKRASAQGLDGRTFQAICRDRAAKMEGHKPCAS